MEQASTTKCMRTSDLLVNISPRPNTIIAAAAHACVMIAAADAGWQRAIINRTVLTVTVLRRGCSFRCVAGDKFFNGTLAGKPQPERGFVSRTRKFVCHVAEAQRSAVRRPPTYQSQESTHLYRGEHYRCRISSARMYNDVTSSSSDRMHMATSAAARL